MPKKNGTNGTPELAPAVISEKSDASVAGMLHAVIERGVTQDNVAALEKLCDLYERMQTKAAEKEFAQAFVTLQSEMTAVEATQSVPNKDGSERYKFAPYPELMRGVQPLLTKHGFTVTFNTRFLEGRITSICTLMHTGGHSRSNEFAVRIGGGPPGATETQADGAAKTYAKRGALCDALNIVVSHDDDARAEGAAVTPEQAKDLKTRVRATNTNEEKFLAFAGGTTFEDIPAAKYEVLNAYLCRKELP